jgi:hypothetical protein
MWHRRPACDPFSSFLGVVAHAMNNSSENPCQRMKGFNGWKISWHFLSVGESSFHRFWALLAP